MSRRTPKRSKGRNRRGQFTRSSKSRRRVRRNPPRRRESPHQLGLFGAHPPHRRTKGSKKRGHSPARRGPACGCSKSCCRAAGVRCACACHGRNHGGVGTTRIRRNPPAGSRVSHRIPCERFPGQPVELRYRRGGVVYKHKLGPGVQMLRVKGASAIVLKGVRVNPYLEG